MPLGKILGDSSIISKKPEGKLANLKL